jgi:outer membrane receptor protein involved in Fe transport
MMTNPKRSIDTANALACTILLALALNLLSIPAQAQSGNQGSVEGAVTDSSGGVIAGVVVGLRNLETSTTFVAPTNEVGLFRFPIVQLGAYELKAEHPGFAPLTIARVVVNEGARINLPLVMSLAEHLESLTISARQPVVESTRTDVSTTIDDRTVANMPVNGRDFANLALLAPGVTRDVRGGLSFAGQRASNVMRVDGVEDNDPIFDQPLAGGFARDGRGAYQFSQSAIEELRVSANGYSAELGHASGGVVSVVTKSGTNEFRGTTFEFYRDKALNANDPVNVLNGRPKPAFHVNQAGGVLGGPLRKDALFFFFNYEALRSTVPNTVVLNVPGSFRFSANPDSARFERRALEYLSERAQSWQLPLTQNIYLPKLDWQLAPGHLVTGRWNRQLFVGGNLGLGPQTSFEHATVNKNYSDTVAGTLTSTLSSSTVNVARFNYLGYDAPWLVQSPNAEASIFQSGQPVLTIGQASARDLGVHRAEWSDTVSHLHRHHTLKFGADMATNRIKNYTASNFAGSYRFNSLESFGRSLAGVPAPASGDQYTQAFSADGAGVPTVHPSFWEISAFAQDDWRVRSNVTLDLGVRYDLQPMTKPPARNTAAELAAAGLDTSALTTDKRDLAPRLGVAWTPRNDARVVVRGGYGLFFGRTPGLTLSNVFLQNGITVQTQTFKPGSPSASLIPSYPNSLCGPPTPSGAPSGCLPPVTGGAPPLLLFYGPGYRQPYTQQASAGAEFQLQRDVSLAVSYLFVKGSDLQRVRDLNLSTTTRTSIGIAGSRDRLIVQQFPAVRPLPDFDRILAFLSDAGSAYHGVTAQLTKRLSNKIQLLASYTLGKVIDDAPNVYWGGTAADYSLLSDATNPRADWGPGVNDQRHRLSVSGVWDLDYADRFSGGTRALLRGWQASFILTAQSGQPYSGMVNFDLNNDGNAANDRTPGSPRDSFYMPSTVSLDPRLMRTVNLGRRASLQIACEAFNILNRTNIVGVRTTQYAYVKNDATACGIAGTPCLMPQDQGLTAFGAPMTSAGARVVQLSGRLTF